MIISYKWLKELVDFKESPKEIAEMLLFLGLETTIIENLSAEWKNIIVAKVLDVQKHPNADKLKICSVTDGKTTYNVVCGASNVDKNQIVPLALVGAVLPGNLIINRAKIRGIESEGMICSEKELGLSEHSSGIMVLSDEEHLGKPLKEALGNDDDLLEVEINTNRSDCLSHAGIARELAAKLGKKVNLPKITEIKSGTDIKIEIKDNDLCPRYIGCLIKDVAIKPSPSWIRKKLEKCGIRPINNVVDITNYVMLELGHPMHAFDLDSLAGRQLIIRKAKKDENILALDGKEYKLNDSMLVIADEEKPQAIAGVMGGENSGVTGKTKDIILESAIFKPASVRKTSKTLNLSTDSSYRFERGAGWTVAEMASWRAVNLIQELAGGKLKSRIDRKNSSYKPVKVELRPKKVEELLGLEISNSEIKKILNNLLIKTKNSNNKIICEIPSWRLDIKLEADIIEEIIRIKGYDKVPVTMMPIQPDFMKGTGKNDSAKKLSQILLGLGFSEAINYSFCESSDLSKFELSSKHKIANPLSRENEYLRPSLLPNLWKNLILNINEGYDQIKLFEIGNVFEENSEEKNLGIIISGKALGNWWGWPEGFQTPAFNFYFLNGFINHLFNGNDVVIAKNENPASYFHPGKTAEIRVNNKIIGKFGILRPDIVSEVNSEIGYAEIYLERLQGVIKNKRPQYSKISRYPSVKRDLSLVAGEGLEFDRILDSINQHLGDGIGLKDFKLFSVFKDNEKLGQGKVSYSLHLTFRHSEHTLTDQEINGLLEKILISLKTIGVNLRA